MRIEIIEWKYKKVTMKRFILTLVLIQFVVSISNSQSISTNKEVYNFDIGDVYHYKHESFDSSNWNILLSNVKIISKFYSANLDTLFYIRNIITREDGSGIQINYKYYDDTVCYTDLNQQVNNGSIDSVYYDLSLYNSHKINLDTSSNSIATQFVDSLGKVYDLIEQNIFTNRFNERRLVYYKKGVEEWGIAIPLSLSPISNNIIPINVYPNPATSYIIFKLGLVTNEIIELTLYNVKGQVVKSIDVKQKQIIKMDISFLKSGVYYYSIIINEQKASTGKFIKN